jgi:hypothetical protein
VNVVGDQLSDRMVFRRNCIDTIQNIWHNRLVQFHELIHQSGPAMIGSPRRVSTGAAFSYRRAVIANPAEGDPIVNGPQGKIANLGRKVRRFPIGSGVHERPGFPTASLFARFLRVENFGQLQVRTELDRE